MKNFYDVIIIGGGPAGLASAIEAKKTGAGSVLIIERNDEPGGILLQCIHNGFGSVIFRKDLPGPAYAQKFIEEAYGMGIECLPDTMVLDITPSLKIYAANRDGYLELQAGAVVLAMGCRERTRAQIRVPGSRPAGVYTAGMVQRMVNIEGYMPGKEFVILGSGDIGMIMARRLVLEGANVKKVLEIMPFLTGLRRNYVQCLKDFEIPLRLGTTIKRIIGNKRVEGVETVRVDNGLKPVPGSEEFISCDSVLLSVGLIPENELSKKAGVELDPATGGPIVDESMSTNVPGIFAAGNVVTIYDLVDYVSKAGYTAGRNAALFSMNRFENSDYTVKILPGENVRSVVPQKIHPDRIKDGFFLMELRVNSIFENKVWIDITDANKVAHTYSEKYARPAEMITIQAYGKDIFDYISEDVKSLTVRVVEA